MPTTGPLRASLISALPGGSGNFFFSPTGGTLVLAFRAGFAGNDGGEHILIDCAAWGGDIGRNRLLVKKRADNFLHVIHYGANSGATALEQLVTWAADTEHVLMVQWGADLTSLSAKLDGVLLAGVNYYHRYGSTRKYGDGLKYGDKSGTPSGAEQVMAGSPTAVMLGTDLAQTAGRFSGAFGALSLYSVAYGLPSVLERYAHPMRTYYPRGEFIDAVFRPIRAQPGAEHYYYTLRIRDGR
jgi:hypothetical protein